MKILVIELAYIGDTLMATPFLRALKNHQPYAELSFLASSSSAEVLHTNPNLSRVLAFDKKSGPLGLIRAVRFLRGEQFDLAFVLHRSFKSAVITALAGIPVRIGYGTESRSGLLTSALPYDPKIHRAKNHLALFEYYRLMPPRKELGVMGATWDHAHDPDNPVALPDSLELVVPDETLAAAKEKFLNGVGDYFVLNPGGSWPTKRWLAEKFAEVGNRLAAEKKWTPVIIGSAGDRWLNVGKGAVDLRGQTSLLELAAVLKGAKLLVSNDSGPLHIGVAVGVPTVSVFGPTDSRRTGPFSPDAVLHASPTVPPTGAKHVALQAQVVCSPCYLKECPDNRKFVCMKSISAEQVLAHARRVAGA